MARAEGVVAFKIRIHYDRIVELKKEAIDRRMSVGQIVEEALSLRVRVTRRGGGAG